MKVKKNNKTLTIPESRLNSYLKQGYDRIDEETGKIIERATGGRSVSLPEYNKLLDEKEKLAEEVAKLKAENKKLKAEAKKQGE